MFCRRAWQRVGPLARKVLRPTSRNAPVRHMAFGIPGGSTNMTYFLLCGGGLTAAVVYAYKTVNGESERPEDKLADIGSLAKGHRGTRNRSRRGPRSRGTRNRSSRGPRSRGPKSLPDLLTAVKILAGSTVDIAAASVGETSLVKSVRQIEEDGKDLEPTLEVVEVTTEVVSKEAAEEAAEVVIVEELKSAEAGAHEEVAEAPSAEEGMTEETPAPAEEEATASPPGEGEVSGHAVEVGEVSDEDEVPGPEAAPEEAVSSTGASPEVTAEDISPTEVSVEETASEVTGEDISPAEASVEEAASEASPGDTAEDVSPAEASVEEAASQASAEDVSPAEASVEEATSEDITAAEEANTAAEAAPLNETSPVEITPAAETTDEASAEDGDEMVSTHSEAVAVVDTAQLAAASTTADLEVLSAAEPESASEAPVHEEAHCHSCHSAPSAGEEVMPLAALEEELVSEGAVDITHVAMEVVSDVEGQKPEVSVWTVKSCSVM
nr:PREDICTED: skin secretory protein xP2-like [Paralichthys olivaceus]